MENVQSPIKKHCADEAILSLQSKHCFETDLRSMPRNEETHGDSTQDGLRPGSIKL